MYKKIIDKLIDETRVEKRAGKDRAGRIARQNRRYVSPVRNVNTTTSSLLDILQCSQPQHSGCIVNRRY